MTEKEIIKIINTEIKWSREHNYPDINTDFKIGFITGLKQAVYLIKKAVKEGK
jgi:hypothetical protein